MKIEQIRKIIKLHEGLSNRERQRFDMYRRWYNSEYWEQDNEKPQGAGGDEIYGSDSLNFETNYAYAAVDTLIANVCPTNPEITVTARNKALKDAAKLRAALINETFYKLKAHKIIWKAATEASVYDRSWVKASYRIDRKRPQFLVVDPRMVWFDREASCEEDMRYLIHVVLITKDEFDKRIEANTYDTEVAKDVRAMAFPQWATDRTGGASQNDAQSASRQAFDWITLYEFYDFIEDKYYVFADRMEKPILASELPYKTLRNPFKMLVFNDNLRNIGGLSDVKLIAPQQRVLNELQTLKLWHALVSIPITLVQEGMVDNPEALITALSSVTGPGEIVKIKGRDRVAIGDIVSSTNTPSLSPNFSQMEEEAKGSIESILSLPRYSRGEVGVADIATEVALADTAVRTRNSRRQKAIYDLLTWMAEATIAIYTLYLDQEVPVRLLDEEDITSVDREMLKLQLPADATEEIMDYDYEARAFNAPENNRIVMLKLLREHWDALAQGIQAGAVDPRKLITRLAELLSLDDILKDAEVSPDPFTPLPTAPEGDPNAGGNLPMTTQAPETSGGPMPGPESPGGIMANLAPGVSPIAAGTNQYP
jgi:hypothetical protein